MHFKTSILLSLLISFYSFHVHAETCEEAARAYS